MKIIAWLCVLLAAALALGLTADSSHALPFWECCRLGNPGCCYFVLIELWWDGLIDFPGAGMD